VKGRKKKIDISKTPDPRLDFTYFYYEHLLGPLNEYKERIKNGNTKLQLGEIKNTPWDIENNLKESLVKVTPEQFKHNTCSREVNQLLDESFRSFLQLAQIVEDSQRHKFIQQMYYGAMIQAYHEIFVTKSNFTNVKGLYQMLKIKDERAAARCRTIYCVLIREYNLLLYTGCSIYLLEHHKLRIVEFFEKNPDKAAPFISLGDSGDTLTFAERVWKFSNENQNNLKKIKEKPRDKRRRHNPKEDEELIEKLRKAKLEGEEVEVNSKNVDSNEEDEDIEVGVEADKL